MRNNANRLFVFLLGAALLLGCGSANAVTPMVSAGGYFAIALKTDGTLTAWGRNDHGQLGNGHAAQLAGESRRYRPGYCSRSRLWIHLSLAHGRHTLGLGVQRIG